MGSKMKTIITLLVVFFIVFFITNISCLRPKIEKSDIVFLIEKKYNGGNKDLVYGVNNVCPKKFWKYEDVLLDYTNEVLDTMKNKNQSIVFLQLNKTLKNYWENNFLKNLDGVEFDEMFEKQILLQVSRNRLDTTKHEFSWFNSKLSKRNKSIIEMIDEVVPKE